MQTSPFPIGHRFCCNRVENRAARPRARELRRLVQRTALRQRFAETTQLAAPSQWSCVLRSAAAPLRRIRSPFHRVFFFCPMTTTHIESRSSTCSPRAQLAYASGVSDQGRRACTPRVQFSHAGRRATSRVSSYSVWEAHRRAEIQPQRR